MDAHQNPPAMLIVNSIIDPNSLHGNTKPSRFFKEMWIRGLNHGLRVPTVDCCLQFCWAIGEWFIREWLMHACLSCGVYPHTCRYRFVFFFFYWYLFQHLGVIIWAKDKGPLSYHPWGAPELEVSGRSQNALHLCCPRRCRPLWMDSGQPLKGPCPLPDQPPS